MNKFVIDRQTNRQTNRQTDKQTDKQTAVFIELLPQLKIIFQKVFQLPKSRWSATKDKLINIPVSPNDVMNTITSLPRTPSEAGLVEVKLKRKLEYKGYHRIY